MVRRPPLGTVEPFRIRRPPPSFNLDLRSPGLAAYRLELIRWLLDGRLGVVSVASRPVAETGEASFRSRRNRRWRPAGRPRSRINDLDGPVFGLDGGGHSMDMVLKGDEPRSSLHTYPIGPNMVSKDRLGLGMGERV